MLRVLFMLLIFVLEVDKSRAGFGQFEGGSISFSVRNDSSSGKLFADLDILTGWVFQKGPCGRNCSRADIGKTTNSRRVAMETAVRDALYFGNWTAEYRANRMTRTTSLNTIISSKMKEVVLRMNTEAKWEQELMKVSVELEPANTHHFEDIYFEGGTWHFLNMQTNDIDWHMQAKIDSRVRSDTGVQNKSPLVFMRPLYRIQLNRINKIHIAAADRDNDHIQCFAAQFAESGVLSRYPLQGLTVYENCTVVIDADANKFGYHDDAWGAVALTVRDYNRRAILIGSNRIGGYAFSLAGTPVQFLVQVLDHLDTPTFVTPTADANHHFILYAGAVWRQNVYAKANENTTISEFNVLGREQEIVLISTIQDGDDPRVRYVEVKWIPTKNERGNHIICITAVDDTGVESDEDRCFTIEIRPVGVNHSSAPVSDRPYFIDLPANKEMLECAVDTTCVLPLYIKSNVSIARVVISKSFAKTITTGPVTVIKHNGMAVYESDLSFYDILDSITEICFYAIDTNGIQSDEECIQSNIDPPDPCRFRPCRNGGQCERSEKDPITYICKCLNDEYSGKNCEVVPEACVPNPCNNATCYRVPPSGVYCDCTGTGYSGLTCSAKKDMCHPDRCNGHGICESGTCTCFSRYSGANCTTDNCASQRAGQLTCVDQHCTPDPCHGHGVCTTGGRCICSIGYKGSATCNKASGDVAVSQGIRGTKFISPSLPTSSTIMCYSNYTDSFYNRNEAGYSSGPCRFSVYFGTSVSSVPSLKIYRAAADMANSSVSTVTEAQYIPGLRKLYTAEVTLNSAIPTGTKYLCLMVEAGYTSDRLCLEIVYTENPLEVPESIESHQKTATHKFIDPTPNAESRFICYVNRECSLILRTNVVTGVCDNVVTADANVFTMPAQNQGSECYTEVVYKFPTEGRKRICFVSSLQPSSQIRCYYLDVYSPTTDKCAGSPCQNDGDCFHKGRTDFHCVCHSGYTGDYCEKGECQLHDNPCDRDSFCYADHHQRTCICPVGMTGPLCRDRSTSTTLGVKFTDTGIPETVTCVVNRRCTIPLAVSNVKSSGLSVNFGYVSPGIRTEWIATGQASTNTSRVSFTFKPLQAGLKTVCLQTVTNRSNDGEICIKVNATLDYSSIYGYMDRPHFIAPSLPMNANVRCPIGENCHVLYHVTPGSGHEKQCVDMIFTKLPFEHGHIFSSCSNCLKGYGSSNCSIDVSVIPSASQVNETHEICVAVELKPSDLRGEERCFNVTVQTKLEFTVRDPCQPSPCVHGTCQRSNTYASCQCDPGYIGEQCDRVPFNCHRDRCVNGKCQDFVFSSHCACFPGYVGQRCETTDECASNPCQNSGVCQDGIGHYTCNCVSAWTGFNCEIEVNECASSPCQNSGVCQDDLGLYTCSCTTAWTGTNCETEVNECASSPCQNSGVCQDGLGFYTCSCTSGWTGTNCETVSAQCPVGWDQFGTSCYFTETATQTWSNAQAACSSYVSGGHLLNINTESENNDVISLFNTNFPGQSNTASVARKVTRTDGHCKQCRPGPVAIAASDQGQQIWIGGLDTNGDEIYRWTDGTLLTSGFEFWYTGQPDNWGGNEDCLLLRSYQDFKWNDGDCSSAFWSICEKELA